MGSKVPHGPYGPFDEIMQKCFYRLFGSVLRLCHFYGSHTWGAQEIEDQGPTWAIWPIWWKHPLVYLLLVLYIAQCWDSVAIECLAILGPRSHTVLMACLMKSCKNAPYRFYGPVLNLATTMVGVPSGCLGVLGSKVPHGQYGPLYEIMQNSFSHMDCVVQCFQCWDYIPTVLS